jgi:hypothetical protein
VGDFWRLGKGYQGEDRARIGRAALAELPARMEKDLPKKMDLLPCSLQIPSQQSKTRHVRPTIQPFPHRLLVYMEHISLCGTLRNILAVKLIQATSA